ncbi:DUF3152 domain-containing protein [Streptomyces lycii]|uniref:DUF3152 domain-containing protein n=1 Tax=Streptomyces lycii TaxID=2654337 RepID=A0ABQ7FPS2_9ACTN|nr:DUF3152 domain-containing protein [Streptomyces lycii]
MYGTPPGGTPAYGTPPRGTPAYGTPPQGTPAHGTPHLGTPPRGTPYPSGPARGGHPEQHEAGGGWGGPVRAPAAPAGYGVGVASPLLPAAGRVPRPRQEYVDAFDDDVYPAGAPAPGSRGERAADETDREPRTGRDAAAGGGSDEGAAGASGEPPGQGPGGGDDDGDGDPRPAGGRKARAFTGAAAAAVITVLAIVVAGQVSEGGRGDATRATGGEQQREDGKPGEAARSGSRPEQSAPPTTTPLTYEQKMAKENPLDPGLAGSGEFRAVGGKAEAPGKGTVVRYRVDVEKDLPLDGELFAQAVHRTLNDERSWGHGGKRTFERVTGGNSDFVITLASPETTAVWCAKSGLDTTVDNVSCDSAATGRVMINAYRWAQGSKTFEGKIFSYREMLINHEVGHRLGLDHRQCTEQGALAPVMMQQTKTLTSKGLTCKPNAWPHP